MLAKRWCHIPHSDFVVFYEISKKQILRMQFMVLLQQNTIIYNKINPHVCMCVCVCVCMYVEIDIVEESSKISSKRKAN